MKSTLILAGILAFVMSSCATTKIEPQSYQDVKIGDKLTFLDPELSDCSLKVSNIITLKNGPFGLMPTKETDFCGKAHCTENKRTEMVCSPASFFFTPKKDEK